MTEQNHAHEQAQSQLESIIAMVAALNCDFDRLEELGDERARLVCDADEAADCATADIERANLAAWDKENGEELAELEKDAGDCKDADEARQRIEEDALEVQVRADWHNVGEVHATPSEFYILLCTGGPAVRIMGELDNHLQPCRAWLEYQDWGTPWTQYFGDNMDSDALDALLAYCNCFYFGE
jgi:hypothetical protein